MLLTQENFKNITDAISRNEVPDISNCIENIQLEEKQTMAVLASLHMKKAIIALDTGLGKTVVSSALINLISHRKKTIIVVKRGTLDELVPKFRTFIREDYIVDFITGEEKVIDSKLFNNRLQNAKVIIVSSDSLLNKRVNDYLHSIRDSFGILVVDEMHLFSNLNSSESIFIDCIADCCDYVFALTATPMEREIIQVINTCYMIDKNIFGGNRPKTVANQFRVYKDGVLVGYKNLDLLNKLIRRRMINIQSKDCGLDQNYKAHIHLVEPRPDWGEIKPIDTLKITKGSLECQAFEKLIEIIDSNAFTMQKGLIYINLNKNKELVFNELLRRGYRVGISDGSIAKKSERSITKEMFRQGKLDILITNETTASDLECDYIVFYEFTLSYIQYRGRGLRGFHDGFLDIHFILTKNTPEIQKFQREVLQRVQMFAQVIGKEVNELNDAYTKIRNFL